MFGALKGLKIIDFTRLLPGPLATMLMADMGAEVIKIESPTQQDYARDFPPFIAGESAAYLAYNRSKKSLCLDYTSPEGQQIVCKLLESCDILIEQFRPNMMARWGLDYETVRKINPKLIYVSLTGYGQTGEYCHWAGHDVNYMALAGMFSGSQNQAPQMPNAQIADIGGGSYMAVIACLSAVIARYTTGKGQWVDVAMLDGVMPLATNAIMFEWATGTALPRERSFLSGGLLNYNIYPCKEGRIAIGTLEAKFWIKFCELIEKPAWKNRMMPSPPDTFALHKAELETILATKTAAEWQEIALQNDLPISKIYEVKDIEQDKHLQEREMVITLEHPKAGKLKSIGVPLKFSETPAKPKWAAPLLGAHTKEVLQSIGFTEEDITVMQKNKLIN